jgi:predicted nucleic acid-binding protein
MAEDDKFIECAVVAGARAIISGDNHLLSLGEYQGVPVLTAAQCLDRFAD